jgi:hypothetical protein
MKKLDNILRFCLYRIRAGKISITHSENLVSIYLVMYIRNSKFESFEGNNFDKSLRRKNIRLPLLIMID